MHYNIVFTKTKTKIMDALMLSDTAEEMPFITGMLRAAHKQPGAGSLAKKQRPAIQPSQLPAVEQPPMSVSPALSLTPPMDRASISASIQEHKHISNIISSLLTLVFMGGWGLILSTFLKNYFPSQN